LHCAFAGTELCDDFDELRLLALVRAELLDLSTKLELELELDCELGALLNELLEQFRLKAGTLVDTFVDAPLLSVTVRFS
jgi:hypothetical protein